MSLTGRLGCCLFTFISRWHIICYMWQSMSRYCLRLAQKRFRLFCLLYVREFFERVYATVETSTRDFQQFPEGRLDAVLGTQKYNCDVICQDQAPPFLVYSSHVLYRINIWLGDHAPYLSFTSKYLFRYGACTLKVTEYPLNTTIPILCQGQIEIFQFLRNGCVLEINYTTQNRLS
jgi:hypothetical protein